ncbi:hypothetical protein K443DRAFT_92222 [Laccaria amethystina LaAM-08-1]|uniref:Uncharacterized protein n=1 Tax=Laccaria amethystina LaAM-08-1 TaxID=1095629 RepID=A0A0C9WYP5_9AGAR|nr:hypothetical protein K443DRAFT_92222 [Laccaria amethystina LaAM-08-1]
MPFLDMISIMYYILLDSSSEEARHTTFQVNGWMFAIGISITEILLTMRTWAIRGKDHRLTIILPILWALCFAGVFNFMGIFLKSVSFIPPPRGAGYQSAGCFKVSSSLTLFTCWVFIMAYDLVLLILMAIKGLLSLFISVRMSTFSHCKLANAVFLNGLIYYFYLFVMSTINVVLIYPVRSLPRLLSIPNSSPLSMYSILTCCVILDICTKTKESLDWSNPKFSVRLPK